MVAVVLDTLTDDQWAAPSLCAGWSVRDVAAHLTHSRAPIGDVLMAGIGSGFRLNTMMKRLVRSDKRTRGQITAALRATVGSRRRPPMSRPLDPLVDLLVHGQDIAIPLGLDHPMPTPVAVADAEHLWDMRFPMNPQRALAGYRVMAEDADFAVGAGVEVRAPIREVVLILSGRRAPSVLNPGADPA